MKVAPRDIRYAQDSIKHEFQKGKSLESLFEILVDDIDAMKKVPKIRVMKQDGQWYAEDGHRRLYVYKKLQELGVINAIEVVEVRFNYSKYTTDNEGTSIMVRNIRYNMNSKLDQIWNEKKNARMDTRLDDNRNGHFDKALGIPPKNKIGMFGSDKPHSGYPSQLRDTYSLDQLPFTYQWQSQFNYRRDPPINLNNQTSHSYSSHFHEYDDIPYRENINEFGKTQPCSTHQWQPPIALENHTYSVHPVTSARETDIESAVNYPSVLDQSRNMLMGNNIQSSTIAEVALAETNNTDHHNIIEATCESPDNVEPSPSIITEADSHCSEKAEQTSADTEKTEISRSSFRGICSWLCCVRQNKVHPAA